MLANFKKRKMPVLKALPTEQPRAYSDERATQPLKRRWETAIFKQAIAGEVHANELGFEGDTAMMSAMEPSCLFYGEGLDERLFVKFKRLTTLTPKWRKDMRRKLDGCDSFMRL